MNDWIRLNSKFDMKITDETVHIRKLNLKSGKYSYMKIDRRSLSYIWRELTLYESRQGLLTERTKGDGS